MVLSEDLARLSGTAGRSWVAGPVPIDVDVDGLGDGVRAEVGTVGILNPSNELSTDNPCDMDDEPGRAPIRERANTAGRADGGTGGVDVVRCGGSIPLRRDCVLECRILGGLDPPSGFDSEPDTSLRETNLDDEADGVIRDLDDCAG